jgi:hypothetical protein
MNPPDDSAGEVFINCPFDDDFEPLFRAMVFTIRACEYKPRCSKEAADSGEIRLTKLVRIMKDCPLGIHDLSRCGADSHTGLARLNMPFELGLYLGADHFGGPGQRKEILITATKQYEYQKYISDIAGQDIAAHRDKEENVVMLVRNWLNSHQLKTAGKPLPGAMFLQKRYREFKNALPLILKKLTLDTNPGFGDLLYVIVEWLEETAST